MKKKQKVISPHSAFEEAMKKILKTPKIEVDKAIAKAKIKKAEKTA